MDLIINFYKGLDTLNLIIFWGIIIVIILLLVFSFILINKNKKLKKIVEQKKILEEDLPIVNEIPNEAPIVASKEVENNIDIEQTIVETVIPSNETVLESKYEEEHKQEELNVNKVTNDKSKYETQPLDIPTKPYQRNVLREMSLSQTSPIGINRHIPKEDKKTEMIKDLEESLNIEEMPIENNIITASIDKKTYNQYQPQTTIDNKENIPNITYDDKQELSRYNKYSINQTEETEAQKLLSAVPIIEESQEKNDSEKYLEEVSRKLSEAEVPDEVERTDYELQQEEDAIISYKELMEKKDTIQTIDEEEAVISIEELMNRDKQSKEEIEDNKLYNLSEEEANDNFIKELKQFRNDL